MAGIVCLIAGCCEANELEKWVETGELKGRFGAPGWRLQFRGKELAVEEVLRVGNGLVARSLLNAQKEQNIE